MDPTENQHLQHETSQQRQAEREAMKRRMEQGEKPWEEQPGAMSVVDAVRDLEFPKSKDEIANEVGDREVLTSKDKRFPLSDVLGKLKNENEFASVRDFETAVLRHWEGIEYMELPPEQRDKEGGGGVPPAHLNRD